MSKRPWSVNHLGMKASKISNQVSILSACALNLTIPSALQCLGFNFKSTLMYFFLMN